MSAAASTGHSSEAAWPGRDAVPSESVDHGGRMSGVLRCTGLVAVGLLMATGSGVCTAPLR
jgi:hypothetical protein